MFALGNWSCLILIGGQNAILRADDLRSDRQPVNLENNASILRNLKSVIYAGVVQW
jgi:hypothetical protein